MIVSILSLALGCGTEPISPPAPPPPPPPPPVPTTLTLSATAATLEAIGQSAQIHATVRDQNGQTLAATVAWTSSSRLTALAATAAFVAAVEDPGGTAIADAEVSCVSDKPSVATVAEESWENRRMPTVSQRSELERATAGLAAVERDLAALRSGPAARILAALEAAGSPAIPR